MLHHLFRFYVNFPLTIQITLEYFENKFQNIVLNQNVCIKLSYNH